MVGYAINHSKSMEMKKLFVFFAILTVLFSCSVDGYKIKGEYPDAPDGTLVYMTRTDDMFKSVDSAVVDNGRFEFVGRQDTPVVRMLFSPMSLDGGPVVVENGTTRVLLKKGIRRKGTPLNNDLQAFYDARERMSHDVDRFLSAIATDRAIGSSESDSLYNDISEIKKEFVAVLQKVLGENMNNALGAFLLTQSEDYFTNDELYSLMSLVPIHLREPRFNVVYERVKGEAESKLRAMATDVGCRYVNFELPDINDNQVIFSNVVNNQKYTLLDFWASWCPPCRQEMPVIKKIYDTYSGCGVAVVSVSLDTSPQEWKDAVSALQMNWLQLCAPKGGSSEVAAAYGVTTIPTLLLIDSNGKIIMRGSPAYRVLERLEKLLNK